MKYEHIKEEQNSDEPIIRDIGQEEEEKKSQPP